MTRDVGSDREEQHELLPLDLCLGEGSAAERAALRQRVSDDPALALAMAETVTLLEGFRQLRVEPGPHLHCKLAFVIRRAERRIALPVVSSTARNIGWTVAAAAVVLAALCLFDPLGHLTLKARSAGAPRSVDRMALGGATDTAAMVSPEQAPAVNVRQADDLAWESTIERMRQRLGMENSNRLSEALESGLAAAGDPLARWLDPRNALALLRVEHEQRNDTDIRTATLLRQGGMVAVDLRAQHIADQIAEQLTEQLTADTDALSPEAVALAVRALIAVGASSSERTRALLRGSEWLAARLPRATGTELVLTLAPLVEVAAVTDQHVALVRAHGERLLAEVLHADEDTWGRRRPELLAGHVPLAAMADAGRLLRWLPGFGVDAQRCGLVRELLLGQLRERRDAGGEDGPELLAAMVFGSGDMLPASEHDDIDRQLRRWSLPHLAPDFVTAHQLAWSLEPGQLGFTRRQRELRRLAVLGEPAGMGARAAFCLCLATNYAAWRGAVAELSE